MQSMQTSWTGTHLLQKLHGKYVYSMRRYSAKKLSTGSAELCLSCGATTSKTTIDKLKSRGKIPSRIRNPEHQVTCLPAKLTPVGRLCRCPDCFAGTFSRRLCFLCLNAPLLSLFLQGFPNISSS